jgi:hypothetical protein
VTFTEPQLGLHVVPRENDNRPLVQKVMPDSAALRSDVVNG